MASNERQKTGKVYLVGAGPGHPGLITLRGVECLRRAEVVLYDYLANPLLLQHVRPGTELICLGMHGRSQIWPQEEINARLVALAQSGKTVVRLKGGDPAVFARGAEEAETLVNHNIPFEIVPGITAALAAGSYAGIPITHREMASAVALVTGHENEDKESSKLDFAALAQFPGTLVFYMGLTTSPKWSAALIAAGKSPLTPVAIVRRCSFPDQLTLRCTLGDLTDESALAKKIRPPVLVIIGEVVNLAPTLSWFDKRPLFGTRVLVSRPWEQADGLAEPLSELGAEVIVQPAITIAEPTDWSPVDAAIDRIADFDWLVFSSSNGVRYFLERMLKIGRDWRSLGKIRIAAIGPGTAEELKRYHLYADLVPPEFRAEALASSLAASAPGKKMLLVRASRGREVLAEDLRAAGATVEQVVAYNSTDVEAPRPEIAEQLNDGKIQWITVTSSAIARSLARLFGENLKKSRLASISPITSTMLRELGFEPTAEATEYTMQGVVDAIMRCEGKQDDDNLVSST